MVGQITKQINLSHAAQNLLSAVSAQHAGEDAPGLHDWLLALLERHRDVVQAISPTIGDLQALPCSLRMQIQQGDAGDPLAVATLQMLAEVCAQHRGDVQVTEHDLACVILNKAGYAIDDADAEFLSEADCETIHIHFDEADDQPNAPAATTSATPLLDTLGSDLTRSARDGRLGPVIGREEEIDLTIETLCRQTKRNPALIGPAGVGKTAIVEGLAQRVAQGAVPPTLRGARIVMLSVTALTANCKFVGEFEERMCTLLAEARHPGIILFIDEAHTMVGAGAAGRNGNDLANILKPALARGEIACIAATTDEEYRRFIETDPALERRFQPITVEELSAQQALEVLNSVRDRLAELRGVYTPTVLLEEIVTFTEQHLHTRYFPDKAVDLLEQCVAHGMAHAKVVLDHDDLEMVTRRITGMRVPLMEGLARLREALTRQHLLSTEDITTLLQRLEVTTQGFDLRAARPNAILLLAGDAAAYIRQLAETITLCLYGNTERLITLDFARFATQADLTMLIGSPPGYVGYEGRVPLHQLVQRPWCVLQCSNIHACHPAAREVLLRGLREGAVTLADGKRVYLGDTVVVLSADMELPARNPIGFGAPANETSADSCLHDLLGEEFLEQIDLLCTNLQTSPDAQMQWLHESLLADLRERFRPHGIHLQYDPSIYAWLLARNSGHFSQADWERLIDEHLSPLILSHLPQARHVDALKLQVKADGDVCLVERRL